MPLFLAFLLVPLIEIGLFIQVGGLIGLWPTLGIVVLTALVGTALVRSQGALAMGQIRRSFSELDDPSEPLAHGAMILFSGALLLTPGFFTDAVGFALLVPGVRRWAFSQAKKRINIQTVSFGSSTTHTRARSEPNTIDGDYVEVDPVKKPTHGTSGWTKH